MDGLFELPRKPIDLKFYTNTLSTGNGTGAWFEWRKPKTATLVYMLVVGGGSSGINGPLDSVGSGAGGGSGGVTSLLIPAILIPDVLYVMPGLGGVDTGAGVNGTPTYINVIQGTTAANVVLKANGGVASAAGGTGGAVMTQASCPLSNGGLFYALAGVAGQASVGTGDTPGNSATILSGSIVCGGASGGSAQTAAANGGDILASGLMPMSITGGRSGSIRGGDGLLFGPPNYPLCSAGGAGGAGISAGQGGQGGTGGPGSGGGGSGNSNGVGGVTLGGSGGNGFALIISM